MLRLSKAVSYTHLDVYKRQPMYDIKEGVAWDNIPFTPALEELARNTRSVCFGSLAVSYTHLDVYKRQV